MFITHDDHRAFFLDILSRIALSSIIEYKRGVVSQYIINPCRQCAVLMQYSYREYHINIIQVGNIHDLTCTAPEYEFWDAFF